MTKGSAPSMSVSVNAANNRINGYSYDSNGNLTAMTNLTLTYDIENRLVEAVHGVNGTERYVYDPSGQRVWKQEPSRTMVYFYSVDGTLLGTYGDGSNTDYNVYFAGKQIWAETAWGSPTLWAGPVALDRLGSVVHRYGSANRYFPYGDEPATTTQDRAKFATYYRDQTSTLDYARNRYYSRAIGRFTSPDPYMASGGPADPQSWNRYTYATDDPVNFADPSGLKVQCPPGSFYCIDVVAPMGDGSPYYDAILQMLLDIYWQSYAPVPLEDAFAQAGGGGGGGGGAPATGSEGWLAASGVGYAAQALVDKRDWSAPCRSTLETMGVTPLDTPGGLTLDAVSRIQAAATTVEFLNGLTSSTPMSEIYAGSPVPGVSGAAPAGTVGEYFAGHPSTSAMAALGGNRVWINPDLFVQFGSAWAVATVLHELVHNVTGLTDSDFQRALGIAEGPDTRNITIRLAEDCFGWSLP